MTSRAFLASIRVFSLAIALSAAAWGAGFFGTVVPIGGHASDIALDEGRGVLYIANYTANRVEVMSTADRSISTSFNVPSPGSLSLSRDGRYLAVTSYANFVPASGTQNNTLTVISLDTNARRTIALSTPPLAVAFGADGLALVLTTTEFLHLDPVTATTAPVDTFAAIVAKTLPVLPPNFTPQILTASLGVSGDGQFIYGLTDQLRFGYSVLSETFFSLTYAATPPLGPRLVSVNNDGSLFLGGWAAFDSRLAFGYQFADAAGALNIGSHAIDSTAGVIYAQIPDSGPPVAPPTASTVCLPNGICVTVSVPLPAGTPPPVAATPPHLMIVDADNLAVRQRLLIAENLAGRSVLNAARDTLYSISDSGVTIFPLTAQSQPAQLAVSQEDLVFRGAFCDRRPLTQDINITDPTGRRTEFTLSVDPASAQFAQSVAFSATSGVTPATIRVTVDPTAFQSVNGTTAIFVRVDSDAAASLQTGTCPKPAGTGSFSAGCIRLLVNNREPDQRGTVVNVPGTLVDLLADPTRNRFYIVRQDKQVLVFNGANNAQIGTLRTSNNPMQMAITADSKYLLVGHNDAQVISVFDLDTLEESTPIRMPRGFYPRSVAVSGRSILAASRVAGPINQISRVDFENRTATPFPTLGPFENNINADTVLVASPHGAFIMAAMPDGNTLLYDANADTFTVARKDFTALSGAYAASDLGQFAIDNKLLNQSLSRVAELEKGQGGTSGFVFLGQSVLRTTGPIAAGSGTAGEASLNAPGVIQRLDLSRPNAPLSTRTVEAPLFPTANTPPTSGTTTPATSAFSRTLAALSNGAIVSLTRSGFTALPTNFDATTAKPVITGVVNTADRNQRSLTTGSLISILGSNLAQTTASSSATPAPTILGDSCVTLNGELIPLFRVSPPQIDAQLPLTAGTSGLLVVRTPGGISDPFNLSIAATAPSIINDGPTDPGATGVICSDATRCGVFRAETGLPVTLTNPVHKGDRLIIYATGLGATLPAVPAGVPAPSNPPAELIAKPEVTLGGVTLPVTFAGLAPGQIGVYQINVNVPFGITQGLSIPLKIGRDPNSSTVFVRVVE